MPEFLRHLDEVAILSIYRDSWVFLGMLLEFKLLTATRSTRVENFMDV